MAVGPWLRRQFSLWSRFMSPFRSLCQLQIKMAMPRTTLDFRVRNDSRSNANSKKLSTQRSHSPQITELVLLRQMRLKLRLKRAKVKKHGLTLLRWMPVEAQVLSRKIKVITHMKPLTKAQSTQWCYKVSVLQKSVHLTQWPNQMSWIVQQTTLKSF